MKLKIYNPFSNLTKTEWLLWISSMIVVGVSGVFAGQESILNTVASVIGVTGLIFVAKADLFGGIISLCFCILYGFVSLKFKYYGEMITYWFMSAPATVVTIISWLKHPYKNTNQVKIEKINSKKICFAVLISIVVTVVFYFILRLLNTSNLTVSTISVFTSFLACVLLIYRSPYYSIAYSINDIVLIILWILATIDNIKYLPMIFCFVMFLANDLYGFYNWKRMEKRQQGNSSHSEC